MHAITFTDVVLILSFADTAALATADWCLAMLEANEVEVIRVPRSRNATEADLEMHDALIDADPLFLEWSAVQSLRDGRWSGWAPVVLESVDSLPAAEVQ